MPQGTRRSLGHFKLWKTVHLGTGARRSVELIEAMHNEGRFGCWVSVGAREMMHSPEFTIASYPTELSLTIVSPPDLGLFDDLRFGAIIGSAASLGLQLCPAEAGPQLRLQYREQPIGHLLHVAMAPLEDGQGYPRIFVLDSNVGLASSGGRPNNVYRRTDLFAFTAKASG